MAIGFKIIAVIALAQASYLCSAQPPTTNIELIQGSGTELSATLKRRKLDNSHAMEKEIGAIADALSLGNVHVPGIWVCDGCGGTFWRPDLGIVVDTGQLERIRTQSNIADFHWMLVFVVAHEAAHQLQFDTYNRDIYALPRAERLYYEAQADILAGLWLYEDTRINMQADDGSVERTWHAIFDLGVEEYAIAGHPSHTARLYAAKMGFNLGAARNDASHPPFPGFDPGGQLRRLGVQEGETDIAFSLRMARSIVAFNPRAALDLVRISSGDDSITDGRGNVDYRLLYANRGTHTLIVSLEVVCLHAQEKDPEDPFRTMQFSSKAHEFNLPPGGRTSLSGQISCPSLPGINTHIEYPPSRYGLVDVRYADGNGSISAPRDPNGEVAQDLNELDYNPGHDLESWKDAFDRYLLFSRDDYDGLRTGPVLFSQDVGKYFYNTALTVPGAVYSRVEVDKKGHSMVWNTLSKTTDADASAAEYKLVVDLVRRALKETSVPGSNGQWKESGIGYATSFKQSPYTVDVTLSELPVSIPRVLGAFYYELDVDWSGTPSKSK